MPNRTAIKRHKVKSDPAKSGTPFKIPEDKAVFNQFKELVENAIMSRSEFFRELMDPRRNINHECGYPNHIHEINPDHYKDMYDREAIGTRVVEVMPKESWKVKPTVFESDDAETTTAFEQAWQDLGKTLRSAHGESFFKDEEENPVWEYLVRGDIQSGIGHFGVILLGVDDGKELREPLDFVTATSTAATRNLLFLRVFDESLLNITRFEQEKSNPRFAEPTMYQVTLSNPRESSKSAIGLPQSTLDVHWTRIIHLADNLGSSEVIGVPRMRPVWNRLMDLRKVYGGSAEMYWRGAFPGLSIETNPQTGGGILSDDIKDEMEQYMNGLQRYLMLQNMTARSLAPQVSSPKEQVEVAIDAICIRLGIPKRIFMGSERGSLASNQDDDTWNDRLKQRQVDYISPRIIAPFIDRLINVGVLPKPADGYSIVWPDLGQTTDKEKADTAARRVEAMARYVGGSVESILPPMDFLTREMDYDQDAAEAVLESAAKLADEREERELEMREQMEGDDDNNLQESEEEEQDE